MGSWGELDADYPAGSLTPATALILALAYLRKESTVYAADGRSPAAWLPVQRLDGVSPAQLERAEGLLTSLTFEEFLERAAALLWPRQRQALLLMLCNHVLVEGGRRPEQHPVIQALLGAFELDRAWLEQHLLSLRLLNDYAAFPQ
jgi:hypothetical protein